MKLLHEKDLSYIDNRENLSSLSEIIGKTAPMKSDDYSVALTHLETGGSVKSHYHLSSDEIYIFTEGCCEMVINNKTFPVQKGSVILIEKNDWHEILPCNEPVRFYAISVPPFTPEDFLVEKGC